MSVVRHMDASFHSERHGRCREGDERTWTREGTADTSLRMGNVSDMAKRQQGIDMSNRIYVP